MKLQFSNEIQICMKARKHQTSGNMLQILPISKLFEARLVCPRKYFACNFQFRKPASWSSGNAFVSGAEVRGSNLGPVKSDTAFQRLATAATFLPKELYCPDAMTWRRTPSTRYTLRRITASIMKDLI